MTRQCLRALGWILVLGSLAAPLSAAELTADQTEKIRAWLAQPAAERADVATLGLAQALTREQATAVRDELWTLLRESQPAERSPLGPLPPAIELPAADKPVSVRGGLLDLGEHKMPFAVIRREPQEVAAGQRSLLLCLHGGGQNAEADGPHTWPVNNSEWQAQMALSLQVYPADGIYWIPRMADDRLGRWWHKHNQQAFAQVIDHAVLHWGVDPNRVYLLGISEGGYGTDILAPFMADRWAGAAAMAAGVGLDNPPENLRNVAFRTEVGEQDTMFDRRPMAVAYHAALDKLHADDPQGYTHSIGVQPGKGHGIDYRPGPEWISQHTRSAWPDQVVWIDKPLDDQRPNRFYWLAPGERTGRNRLVATANRQQNSIHLEAEQLVVDDPGGHPTHTAPPEVSQRKPMVGALTLLLSDELLDLDQPVQVTVGAGAARTITPQRTAADLLRSLVERPDPSTAASCRIELSL